MTSKLLSAIDTTHPLPWQHLICDYCLFVDAFASLGLQDPICFFFFQLLPWPASICVLVPFPPQLFVEGPTTVLCHRHSLEHPVQVLWDAGLQHQALVFFPICSRGCWSQGLTFLGAQDPLPQGAEAIVHFAISCHELPKG